MSQLTDEELVSLIKKGDILSYEALVRRYEGKLSNFVKRWLWDAGDVEEVVQDALFKLYVNIRKVDEKRKFSSYLYAIAKNESVNKIRKRKDTLPLLDYVQGDDGSEVYERLINEEKKNILNKAMERLTLTQRQILKMYFFEEMTYKKIQERLNIPINTVKTFLRRSKIKLSKLVKHEK